MNTLCLFTEFATFVQKHRYRHRHVSLVMAYERALKRKSAADTVQHAYQPPPRITSKVLLGAARELIIEHDGRDYRLRLTQQGKLILTA